MHWWKNEAARDEKQMNEWKKQQRFARSFASTKYAENHWEQPREKKKVSCSPEQERTSKPEGNLKGKVPDLNRPKSAPQIFTSVKRALLVKASGWASLLNSRRGPSGVRIINDISWKARVLPRRVVDDVAWAEEASVKAPVDKLIRCEDARYEKGTDRASLFSIIDRWLHRFSHKKRSSNAFCFFSRKPIHLKIASLFSFLTFNHVEWFRQSLLTKELDLLQRWMGWDGCA